MTIREKRLGRVIGLTRERSKVSESVRLKAVDYATMNIKGALQDADIIFICYPIRYIIPELKKIIRFVKPGAIITDVGSTKESIVKQAEKIVPKNIYFIGGHPMAGKEKTGLDAADKNLFHNRNYILTATGRTNKKSLGVIKKLISSIGAKVQILDPGTHDNIVAGISHLPVAVASALVGSVVLSEKLTSSMIKFASSGFQDTTRIASGDPMLGSDMFTTNKGAVLSSLKIFKRSLAEIEDLIKKGDHSAIERKLAGLKSFRDSIYK